MAKNNLTGVLLAIGGAAIVLGGAAAIAARVASKRAAQEIADTVDGLEIEVCPTDEETSVESDFVDADGSAEEAPAPMATEEAPASQEPTDPEA